MKIPKKGKANSSNFKLRSSFSILAGFAAGLYPVIFYYSRNFTLLNSWPQFLYLVSTFIILPIIVLFLIDKLFKISNLKKYDKYILPFLSIFIFLFLLKIVLYLTVERKIIFAILIIAALFSYFGYKYFKKLIALQLLLAFIGLITLIPVIYKHFSYSETWLTQPDNIASVQFKTKPNVYFIEPDGYVNFSELRKGFYKHKDDEFEKYLIQSGFTNYEDFRSNYTSTLSSNSSIFMMKHHYYNKGEDLSEALNARKIIISDNTVLSIFKNNGYNTNYIVEHPYLLVNRPEIGYDYTNFSYDEIPFITDGLSPTKNVVEDFKIKMQNLDEKPNFFFIEFFQPGHIANAASATSGAEKERIKWLRQLELSNEKLKQLIDIIKEKDPNGLILIMADHGGYVGMDYAQQLYAKSENADLIRTAYSTIFSVNWPNNKLPEFNSQFVSSVNTFRLIFSYLSEDNKLLENLEENSSWIILKENTEPGIYKYINGKGEITCEKL